MDHLRLRHRPPDAPDDGPGGDGPCHAADAVILWNETRRAISRVGLAVMPVMVAAADDRMWERWLEVSRDWDFAYGSVTPGWMCSEAACPEAVFGFFLVAGFTTRRVETLAYAEFARIRECDWARDALRRCGEGTPQRRDLRDRDSHPVTGRRPAQRTRMRGAPGWARWH